MQNEKKLNQWIGEVETRWGKAPEFNLPQEKLKHLAIICDGNRRAAQSRQLDPYFGHRVGIEVIRGVARACQKWGLKTITFWVWSTENWEREKEQVKYIMNLAARFLVDSDLRREIIENKVKFTQIGRRDRLPPKVKEALISLEKETENFTDYQLNLAMDYGGLDEVARAIFKIGKKLNKDKPLLGKIFKNPQLIFGYLDTAGQALPDLVIRTGVKAGELPHTSGFLPLQTAYSCWSFSPVYFPDLSPEVLLTEIKKFLNYQRRLGK
ncbi:di-trans,poly-cis-decaprenylcistransferase [Candidatus Shapirobacteria bacterium]|nr:di-trans,poly-cis-decaprenylcistransferase [Candidatus Shapirobacteria bacterium]